MDLFCKLQILIRAFLPDSFYHSKHNNIFFKQKNISIAKNQILLLKIKVRYSGVRCNVKNHYLFCKSLFCSLSLFEQQVDASHLDYFCAWGPGKKPQFSTLPNFIIGRIFSPTSLNQRLMRGNRVHLVMYTIYVQVSDKAVNSFF